MSTFWGIKARWFYVHLNKEADRTLSHSHLNILCNKVKSVLLIVYLGCHKERVKLLSYWWYHWFLWLKLFHNQIMVISFLSVGRVLFKYTHISTGTRQLHVSVVCKKTLTLDNQLTAKLWWKQRFKYNNILLMKPPSGLVLIGKWSE